MLQAANAVAWPDKDGEIAGLLQCVTDESTLDALDATTPFPEHPVAVCDVMAVDVFELTAACVLVNVKGTKFYLAAKKYGILNIDLSHSELQKQQL